MSKNVKYTFIAYIQDYQSADFPGALRKEVFTISQEEIDEIMEDGEIEEEHEAVRELLNDFYDECGQRFLNVVFEQINV
jgi:hypothetical protein